MRENKSHHTQKIKGTVHSQNLKSSFTTGNTLKLSLSGAQETRGDYFYLDSELVQQVSCVAHLVIRLLKLRLHLTYSLLAFL